MFFLDALLVALGIYQAIVLANNSADFYYNADTKTGNEVCFQNRIVFVGEIALIGLTVIKDIYFLCCRSNEAIEAETK